MDDRALVWPFPLPESQLIREAYWDLYSDEDGDEAERSDEDPHLPRPWDIATCIDPDLRRDVWDWYEQVVTWFNHEYVWDPGAGMIPPCWPLHPHLVHDIGVLADQRRMIAQAANSNSLEEWHRYAIPAFLGRLRDRNKQHCDEHHQPWPARTRFSRHQSAAQSEGRALAIRADVDTLAEPPTITVRPRPRPRLMLVDENGDTIDPGTGQCSS